MSDTLRMLLAAFLLLAVLVFALLLLRPELGGTVTVTPSASPTPQRAVTVSLPLPTITVSAGPTILMTFAPTKPTAPPTDTQP